MLFKDVLNHMENAASYASVGLVIFFAVFILIAFQAVVRSKRDVAEWARLPLNDGANEEPQQPEAHS